MSSDLWQFLHLPLIFINVGSLEERCAVPGRMSPSLGLSAVALSIRLELWVFGKNIEEMKGPAHCLLAGGTVNPRSIPGEVYCRICPRPAHARSVASVFSDSVRPPGLQPARLLSPWDLQARALERVAMPSSKGSFRHRNWTLVSCVSHFTSGFFTAKPLGKPTCPGQCLATLSL